MIWVLDVGVETAASLLLLRCGVRGDAGCFFEPLTEAFAREVASERVGPWQLFWIFCNGDTINGEKRQAEVAAINGTSEHISAEPRKQREGSQSEHFTGSALLACTCVVAFFAYKQIGISKLYFLLC